MIRAEVPMLTAPTDRDLVGQPLRAPDTNQTITVYLLEAVHAPGNPNNQVVTNIYTFFFYILPGRSALPDKKDLSSQSYSHRNRWYRWKHRKLNSDSDAEVVTTEEEGRGCP